MTALDVKDVSSLKNVKYLDISWCILIDNISGLKNVKILKIGGLVNLNTSILKNTKVLKI